MKSRYTAIYGDNPEMESFEGTLEDAKDYFVSLLDSKNASIIEVIYDCFAPIGFTVCKYVDGEWIDC